MDFRVTRRTLLAAQKNLMSFEDLELLLLSYIDEGGEEGLNKVIHLLDFSDEMGLKVPYTYAPELAAMHWGLKGLSRLAETALSFDDISDAMTIMNTLSFAASASLDDLMKTVEPTYQFPNLQKRLDLTHEKY